jgi:hypothetical protein
MRQHLLALVLVLSTDLAHGQSPTILGGAGAGVRVANSPSALIAGNFSGATLQESPFAVLYGANAGQELKNSRYATAYSHRSHQSVLIGMHSGYRASDSDWLITIGRFTGAWADNSPHSVMIGYQAGGVEARHQGGFLTAYATWAGHQRCGLFRYSAASASLSHSAAIHSSAFLSTGSTVCAARLRHFSLS